jgi:hypothetical protein
MDGWRERLGRWELWREAAPAARIGDNAAQRWQPLQSLDEVGLPAPVRKLLLGIR